ncbi:MAG TPA: hypothetical protein VI669_02560 [Vicinamibacteria bacterium]
MEDVVEGALVSLDDEAELLEDEPVASLDEDEESLESLDEAADSPDFVPSPFEDFLA